jgi:hypothetical protein
MAPQKGAGISLTRMAKDLNRHGVSAEQRGELLNVGNVKDRCKITPPAASAQPALSRSAAQTKSSKLLAQSTKPTDMHRRRTILKTGRVSRLVSRSQPATTFASSLLRASRQPAGSLVLQAPARLLFGILNTFKLKNATAITPLQNHTGKNEYSRK